jgi:hypothetical protein
MHKGSENYLMDNLFLCIKRTEHCDPNLARNQMPEKTNPKKELSTLKKLHVPKLFRRRSLSSFSTRRALSIIKDYWKK